VKTVTQDGVELWYDIQGDGEPLVLTGGFGLLHDQFAHVTSILAEEYQVVNWNWRGSGESERISVANISVDTWTQDLRTILDAARITNAYFWATSVGSLVQTRFAGLHPERVKALVMYPQVKVELERRRRYLLYADVLEVLGWEGLARVFSLALSEDRLNTAEGMAFIAWERAVLERNLSAESFYNIIQAVAYADVSASLSKIKHIPLLLLAGDSGPLGLNEPITKARVELIRDAVPDAVLRAVDGTGGTYCMLEKPRETAAAVIEFIRSVAAH